MISIVPTFCNKPGIAKYILMDDESKVVGHMQVEEFEGEHFIVLLDGSEHITVEDRRMWQD
jgi:hypothetical protein